MASNTSPGNDAAGDYTAGYNTDAFNPDSVNFTAISLLDDDAMARAITQITCYFQLGDNENDGQYFGARISSLFVILVVSTAVTFFPVLAARVPKMNVPIWVYLFARYFGAGVIIATAFIHLLDPAYGEIGPNTCVGMTGGWAEYSWPPALALTSAMVIFLMDFSAERYVEKKYGLSHGHGSGPGKERAGSVDYAMMRYEMGNRRRSTHQALHSADQDVHLRQQLSDGISPDHSKAVDHGEAEQYSMTESEKEELAERSFWQQITGFLILEFGVLFHSAIIGLTLATAGPDEFPVLYVVIVFHQSFEGLGIGARLSAIFFPKRFRWMPYFFCLAYGLTTPIAIAAGLGVRTTYNSGSFTANVVSGVLDSISAGILLYTGFVELLARDFLFNPDRTDDDRQLAFMLVSLLLGAGLMALLGKWA